MARAAPREETKEELERRIKAEIVEKIYVEKGESVRVKGQLWGTGIDVDKDEFVELEEVPPAQSVSVSVKGSAK